MKNFLIIGASEFGKHLAAKLTELGNEICLVDLDENLINFLAVSFENTYIGDCRDINALRRLGIRNFDVCIVAVGGDFQASMEITSNLKELGAASVLTQCNSDAQAKFLTMAGADRTFYPQKEIAERVAYLCDSEKMIDFFSISSDMKIVKIPVPGEWVGRNLIELNLRQNFGVNLVAMENGGSVSMPDAQYRFCESDVLMVLGTDKQLKRIMNL